MYFQDGGWSLLTAVARWACAVRIQTSVTTSSTPSWRPELRRRTRDSTTTHRFTAAAVRDVCVAVGRWHRVPTALQFSDVRRSQLRALVREPLTQRVAGHLW
jgi:hypothetical protein